MGFLRRLFSTGIMRSVYLATIAVLVFAVVLAVGNMTSGIQSIRVMRVFDNDEARIAEAVLRNLKENSPNPHGFFNYGHLYQTACFAVIKVWNALSPVGFILTILSMLAAGVMFLFDLSRKSPLLRTGMSALC